VSVLYQTLEDRDNVDYVEANGPFPGDVRDRSGKGIIIGIRLSMQPIIGDMYHIKSRGKAISSPSQRSQFQQISCSIS
jgi:hypothetical protein